MRENNGPRPWGHTRPQPPPGEDRTTLRQNESGRKTGLEPLPPVDGDTTEEE